MMIMRNTAFQWVGIMRAYAICRACGWRLFRAVVAHSKTEAPNAAYHSKSQHASGDILTACPLEQLGHDLECKRDCAQLLSVPLLARAAGVTASFTALVDVAVRVPPVPERETSCHQRSPRWRAPSLDVSVWHADRLGMKRSGVRSLDNAVLVPWDVVPPKVCKRADGDSSGRGTAFHKRTHDAERGGWIWQCSAAPSTSRKMI